MVTEREQSGWDVDWSAHFRKIEEARLPKKVPEPLQAEQVLLPPELTVGQRGALVMPFVQVNEYLPELHVETWHFEAELLRAACLLFENLAYPGNDLHQLGYLKRETGDLPGFYDCTTIMVGANGLVGQYGGHPPRDLFRVALGGAYNALDEREPGLWTLARSAQGIGLPDDMLGGFTAFKLKLENALPLPDRTVPLEDVLLYRERRRDELRNLRSHLEEVALQVGRDGFGGLAETRAYEDFLGALADHSKAIAEANFKKALGSLEVKFNWDKLISPLMGGGALMLTGEWKAAALGVVLGAISIESTVGLRRESGTPKPFDYVFTAHREL